MRASIPHRARRCLLALALSCAALLCAAPAALAVGLTVDSLADSEGGSCSTTAGCTLREAVDLVAEGEEGPEEIGGEVTIGFDVTGTIEIGDELEIFLGEGVDSLTIAGPGRDELTIDAQGLSRAFTVDEGEVEISGLTVENGSVTGFALDGDGGGALFQAGGAVTLEDVHFTDNHIESTRAGGAIDVEGGDLTIVDSTIDHNSTDADVEGPGGGINVDAGDSTLTLRGTEVDDNFAEGPGGGIYQDEGSLVIADGSTVNGNESTYFGGGIATDADGERTTTISAAEISGNKAAEGGGGVFSENGIGGVEIVETTIAANKASEGGGVKVEGPTTISSSTISGNEATVDAAGGVDVNSALLTLDSSTLAENTGGGLSVLGGEALVRASTIAANANPNGLAGGITGSENNITIKVRSSIVAGNDGESGPGDCAAEVVSEGHNILGTTDPGCTWPQGEGDQLGASPQLGPLADNGGPTLTMAPSTRTSLAINHGGDPKPHDQRGRARPVPVGAEFTDVGAVEVQAPVNEAAPSISPASDLVEGDELTCAPGEWDADTVADPSFTYAWLRGATQIATGATYELAAADAGRELSCRVSADNGATATAAGSDPIELQPGVFVLEPASFDFGARDVGAGPGAAKSFTLRNGGSAVVSVTGISSTDPAQFPLEAAGCEAIVLAPGASCTFSVRFAPTASGAQSATLSAGGSVPTATAALSGAGTTPPPTPPAPQPPAPSAAPPSASVLGAGGAPYTANGAGALPLTIACDSPTGAPCEATLALRAAGGGALGGWSGALAAGASEAIAVPLSAAARARLGARGRLAALAVLATAAGGESSSTLTVRAPRTPKLAVRSAARVGDAIVFQVDCAGYAARCRGKLTLSGSTAELAAGQVSVAKGAHRVRLPLSGAGRRLLALEPRPRVLAEAVARDRLYQRSTTAKTRLRLG